MYSTLFIPYLALFVLEDQGMELRAFTAIPEITLEELSALGNYYSVVLQGLTSPIELYGPLPIPHHPDYHVLISAFKKFDSKLKNPRTIDAEGLGLGQILIIYNKNADRIVKFGYSKIMPSIREFLEQIDDLNRINNNMLRSLVEELTENILLDEQIRSKTIEEIVRDLANRLNTIQMISYLTNKRTRIGVITSDTLSYNLLIQAIFYYQNIDFIYELTRNEYVTRIDTYFMRVVMTLLFELNKIAGVEYFRDIDYFIYIASIDNVETTKVHINNVKKLLSSQKKAKLLFITTEKVEELDVETKKLLFGELGEIRNVELLISVIDVFHAIDNAFFTILNEMLEIGKLIKNE